ncbi:MAG: tyrosine--tRNA ligase [Bacteroidetes bacterium]|nr:tyrosine--tRNA ligase [Bacteroidota bacterium]
MNLIEELKWRGMIQDVMPGTEEQLDKEVTTAYVGFDPTSDSLHIGNLVTIMLLVHLQKAGHKPLALVGGATGMVGDPSGKSEERNLMDQETLKTNQAGIKSQLERFLDFNSGDNAAEIVNNYDWFKDMTFLEFIRDVGKHITVNYMMAKDSVKSRLESGLSFTEFSYQLVQGYDFYHLHKEKNCKLQLGGSDQWGNIVTGTELIRRSGGNEAYALTCPLITKADGGKFGKTESGNVWLDSNKTSVYKFYQFWLNCSDEDAVNFVKIFTLLSKQEIEELENQHNTAPHERPIQKALARDVTVRVHSEKELELAIEVSEILFGKGTSELLQNLSEAQLLDIFEGVPQCEVEKKDLEAGIPIIDFVSSKTGIFSSNGEARRMIQNNGVSINKTKVDDSVTVGSSDMIDNKYVLVQKGKKNYFLVKAL